jgi:beta-glucanase (GH16 family)
MKRKIKIYLLAILTSSGLYAQLPPNVDGNWQLNTGLSDEFNTLDLSKWNVIDLWQGECCNWGGNSRFVTSNVTVSGGELLLKTDAPFPGSTVPYDFWECCNTGGVNTLAENYHYGYYEIYAKLPGNYHNGLPNGQKFWPAFWTYHQENINQPNYVHDEIDILEPSGAQYADGKTNVCGWHDENGSGGSYKVGQGTYTSPNPLFTGYHEYGLEWNADRIIFYFDDVPFYSSYNHPSLIMDPQRVVIGLQIDIGVADFNPSITFPQYMKVDYFRYYQLGKNCSTDVVINNNTDLSNYIFSVKRNITIGNGASTISLNSGDIKTFRATDETTINGDFTVPIGTELNIIPTPCN